jgi:hypothetical protein
MKRITQIEQSKLVEDCTGQMREVAALLCRNFKLGRKTTGEEIREIGGGATQRARDLRLGYTTKNLKPRGMMLWLDPTEEHGGLYWMYPVTWETWVQKRSEREAYELQRIAGVQQQLFRKVA